MSKRRACFVVHQNLSLPRMISECCSSALYRSSVHSNLTASLSLFSFFQCYPQAKCSKPAKYVTETDAWKRPMLATEVQTDFAAIAEKNKDGLKEETVKTLSMLTQDREAEHPSKSDAQSHYSVFELDKDDKVVAAKHWYKSLLPIRSRQFMCRAEECDFVQSSVNETIPRHRRSFKSTVHLVHFHVMLSAAVSAFQRCFAVTVF
ncbi:hypothetical protein KC318_g3 [Hortaea werneckii]|nr:hypothetical protein KC334_g3 [Hortaea werneckii]KAI7676808.1 hypothetical protein KC318_g3 [Hortaea werneckii]